MTKLSVECTNDEEVIDWLSTVLVNHRPEMYCNSAGSNWWNDVTNDLRSETDSELVTILLVAQQSSYSRMAKDRTMRLNAIQDMTFNICTAQIQDIIIIIIIITITIKNVKIIIASAETSRTRYNRQ